MIDYREQSIGPSKKTSLDVCRYLDQIDGRVITKTFRDLS
jgi:hypothetical protein